MKRLFDLAMKYYRKYREVIVYLITGGITTVINFAVFFVLTNLLDIHYITSNIIAWAAAVIAAFLMNKLIVFDDGDMSGVTIIKQLASFVSFRIVSGVMETGLLYVFVEFMKLNENIVKIVVAVLVVILNYVFSKLIIFKKKR
nr:GtrA family protein [Clostridia bacterium]